MCALCARMAQSKGRERTTMKNRAQKRKKKRTPRTPPKSYKKYHFGSQNGSQNRSRDPLFRSWRPVSRKIDPKTRPRALLGASGGRKKHWTRPRAPQANFPTIFCPSQNRTPTPRGGGRGRSAPCVFSIFLENRCFRVGGVQKSRVQGLRGHSPGLGGEAKASPTTSFACCLKLRFAKLEAPLRGAGAGLTTARPVGRRISIYGLSLSHSFVVA